MCSNQRSRECCARQGPPSLDCFQTGRASSTCHPFRLSLTFPPAAPCPPTPRQSFNASLRKRLSSNSPLQDQYPALDRQYPIGKFSSKQNAVQLHPSLNPQPSVGLPRARTSSFNQEDPWSKLVSPIGPRCAPTFWSSGVFHEQQGGSVPESRLQRWAILASSPV